MLSGKFCRPLLATWMIAKLNLYPLIWKIPIQTDNNIGMNQTGQAGQTGLGHGNAVVTSIASSVNNVLEFVPLNSLIEKSANWQVSVVNVFFSFCPLLRIHSDGLWCSFM